MQRLLGAAAGSATASACAGAEPARPTVDIQGSSVAVTTPVGSASAPDLPPKPKPTAQEPDHGYLVVDMLPPPAACANVAPSIGAKAQWKKSKNGLVIEVLLGKPTFPGAEYTQGAIQSQPGTLTIKKQAVDQIIVEITPAAGATGLYVIVPVKCPAGQSRVEVDVTSIPAAKDGTPVNVSLTDTY